jgi:hypothetical protein
MLGQFQTLKGRVSLGIRSGSGLTHYTSVFALLVESGKRAIMCWRVLRLYLRPEAFIDW